MPKSNKIEYEKRLLVIQEWILEDIPYTLLFNRIMSVWKIKQSQAKKDISLAWSRLVEQEQVLIDHKRKLRIEGLKKHKRSLKDQYKGTPRGIEALLKIDKEISKLEGLYPATKLEVSGTDGDPLFPKLDLSKLSKEELKAIVLAAKKARIDTGTV